MKMTKKDLYTTFVQLVIHAESISWSRLNNFLIFNSILVLAWASIFISHSSCSTVEKIVMCTICVFGGLSTIAFANLGKRGREYLDEYKAKCLAIETDSNHEDSWKENIDNSLKPFQIFIQPKTCSSSQFLLGKGPYFFLGLYVILLISSLSII